MASLSSEYSNTSNKMVEQLFRGVWNTEQEHKHIPYHLIENMYHAESGLYSEGCWHNFVMGLNMFYLLKNAEFNEFCKENNVKEKLSKLSQAVYKLNFDASHGLFYQRQASGIWQSSTESIMEERREFWKTNKEEKKLISNTMGLLFFATIGQEYKPEDLDLNKFCKKIIDDFYDSEKQMWATKSLPKGQQVNLQHYRLVDHSLLYLALKKTLSNNSVDQALTQRLEQVVEQVLEVILKKFKVETSERITYFDDKLTPHTKKFLWQDCWLVMALISSKKHNHLIPQLLIEMHHDYYDEESGFLFNESYGSIQDKSTIQIKMVENQKRKISPNSHQMYISFINDNALFYFILKNRHLYLNSDNTEISHKIEELWTQTHASFSNYIEKSKVKHDPNTNEQRLLVSDYLKRQGLWANSEVIWTLLASFDELQ
ncbi:predicted protein [Naegleria gruberi]|uniref:Predicted protein n=1 Tax=Naegleria gruberi TaxID=5762 RepID=D2V280_NAEGR|nr:uncharacterized protein NAEGRDRAFT_62910 [Naegleria gruberi]EFC49008.1 predicted protein [Naegleria gruberi]|eukprot:XP_002681752.1 predicted protein [Naegleria gruberi strain NEG-M]